MSWIALGLLIAVVAVVRLILWAAHRFSNGGGY
jgi:hypothetical protein